MSKLSRYRRGVTTLNKVMYNFTCAAQALLSRECVEKVSMRSLLPHFGSVTEILNLTAKICVDMSGKALAYPVW